MLRKDRPKYLHLHWIIGDLTVSQINLNIQMRDPSPLLLLETQLLHLVAYIGVANHLISKYPLYFLPYRHLKAKLVSQLCTP